jgi:uncharacterized membrane protein YeiB
MNKIKAFLIHLLISAGVIGLLLLNIYYIWYPKPFFEISGVIEPLKLLIIVDVIIGPLLTLIVYKKGKETLVMDLSVIALIQIAALVYGLYIINGGRPSMVVFNSGQFHYLAEKFGKNGDIQYEELKPGMFTSPKYGYINQLSTLDIYNSYKDIEPISDSKLMLYPHSLSEENMLSQFPKKAEEIKSISSKYTNEEIMFFTMTKEQSTYYVVYSAKQKKIVEYVKF